MAASRSNHAPAPGEPSESVAAAATELSGAAATTDVGSDSCGLAVGVVDVGPPVARGLAVTVLVAVAAVVGVTDGVVVTVAVAVIVAVAVVTPVGEPAGSDGVELLRLGVGVTVSGGSVVGSAVVPGRVRDG